MSANIEGSNVPIGTSPAVQILAYTAFYILTSIKAQLPVNLQNPGGVSPPHNQQPPDQNAIIQNFGLDIERIASEFVSICAAEPLPALQPLP